MYMGNGLKVFHVLKMHMHVHFSIKPVLHQVVQIVFKCYVFAEDALERELGGSLNNSPTEPPLKPFVL